MNKCNGIMGWVFGHKWKSQPDSVRKYHGEYHHGTVTTFTTNSPRKCQRCGAVTGEKK